MNKNQEKNNSTKEMIITVLSVLILIVAVFGISYSIWEQTFNGSKENSINTGYISFSYKESDTNIIKIDNAIPTADESGKKLNGNTDMFDFTVSAKYTGLSSIGYEIYATPNVQTLDSKYIKIYLTDQNNQAISGFDSKVPTYEDLNFSSIENAETENIRTIYKSSLTQSGATHYYRLRIWVSSDYNMPETAKQFSFKVNVKGNA